MKKLDHLSKIYNNYDTFVIDLWGVIHDGISLNHNAINVTDKLFQNSKKVVFLSNAPRPSENVRNFLRKMNMREEYLKHIITSGEAAMHAINQTCLEKFFHLGPARDEPYLTKLKIIKVN